GQPADPDGAGHDRLPGRHRRRHRHQHVPAPVRSHQQAELKTAGLLPGGAVATDWTQEHRLQRVVLLRVVMIPPLLLVAIYVETVSETLAPVNPLYFLIAGTYGLTLVYALAL